MKTQWFEQARYGLFVHFGLFSHLERGEWVMNREGISPAEMEALAEDFHPDAFDADTIADLAVAGGMKYIVFTTMHHEGYRMYDTKLSEFCSTKTGPSRDFTAEMIAAARKRGLKIGLYHSLNNWFDQPDAVAALEDQAAYEVFIENTLARIRELVTQYNPIDILWYDGWWPFPATGWQGERMNAMVSEIQPHILFNGRNGLPGDFATPEQHLTAPSTWRPWEACVTMNDHWSFHSGDQAWKSSLDIIKMLVRVAQGRGNLLLNIGPRADGSIPEESAQVIKEVGAWLQINEECLRETELWTMDPQVRGEHRADWCSHGIFTVRGHDLYLIATSEPRDRLVLVGLEAKVEEVQMLGGDVVAFTQSERKLSLNLPSPSSDPLPAVYRIRCDRPPSIYHTGGMRVPAVDHPVYDPLPSDIAW